MLKLLYPLRNANSQLIPLILKNTKITKVHWRITVNWKLCHQNIKCYTDMMPQHSQEW